MNIRKAVPCDLARIIEIYGEARAFMRTAGNPDQWGDTYPDEDIVNKDIMADRLYICEENDDTLAVFCYFNGDDPTYEKIYDGAWLNASPYGVMHRVAVSSAARGRGVAAFCFDHAYGKCGNLKIDTHRDNIPMQRSLEKNGFIRCGIIYLENGDERIAYQKASINII